MSAAHVHLHRWQQEQGHVQRLVAGLAHADEAVFVYAMADVNVAGALFGHGGEVAQGPPTRQVVMAHEQLGAVWKCQKPKDRPVQRARIGTREVATRGAVVWHEEGIANEQRLLPGVFHQVAHARWSVTWRMQRPSSQVADAEPFFVFEQDVELAAIAREASFGIEQRPEDFLYLGNVRAYGDAPAKLGLEIGRCRKVISVNMGFQQPLYLGAQCSDTLDKPIGGNAGDASRLGVIVQHAVHQGTASGLLVHQQIADGRGCLVIEGVHVKLSTDDHHVLHRSAAP